MKYSRLSFLLFLNNKKTTWIFIQLFFQKQQIRVHHAREMDTVFQEVSIEMIEELLENEFV
jgi:hypothetical protein